MLISELSCAPRIHIVAEVSFKWEKTRISDGMSSKIFLGGNVFGLNSEGVRFQFRSGRSLQAEGLHHVLPAPPGKRRDSTLKTGHDRILFK